MTNGQYRDDERYNQADRVDLLAYIQASGYKVQRKGREYMLEIHDSLKIDPSKNSFYWHSQSKGGGPVQFLMYLENMNRDDAIAALIGKAHVPYTNSPQEKTPTREQNEPLVLPEKNGDYRRLFAYLTKTRGIDAATVTELVKQGKLYESKEHHNCVFVSSDADGNPTGAYLRGTLTDPNKKPFKAETSGSNKENPFVIEGDTTRLYVYEAAIDAMSDATLFKLKGYPPKNHHRIALGGVTEEPLFNYLKRNPQINMVVFRTDNDEAGRNFVRCVGGELLAMGLLLKADFPTAKDINQDLQNFRARQREEEEIEQ